MRARGAPPNLLASAGPSIVTTVRDRFCVLVTRIMNASDKILHTAGQPESREMPYPDRIETRPGRYRRRRAARSGACRCNCRESAHIPRRWLRPIRERGSRLAHRYWADTTSQLSPRPGSDPIRVALRTQEYPLLLRRWAAGAEPIRGAEPMN